MLKRVLPWVFSLALIAYLALTTDITRVWAAFRRAPGLEMAAVAIGGTLVAFVWDSLSLTLLFRRFNTSVRFREVLPLKGASYFLNIINYNAAMGGMALYLRRVHDVSLFKSASSLLFMNVIDVFALSGLIGVGLLLAGPDLALALSPEARHGLLVVVGGFGALLVGTWIYWNAGFDFLLLGRLRSWRIFHAFREARVVDYAWLIAMRLVMVLLYVVIQWLFARVFDIEVPFGTILILQSVVIFVGTLPITVAGLGTTQVVMRAVYGVFATYLVLEASAGPALRGVVVPMVLPPGAGVAAVAAQFGARGAVATYFDPTALVDAFSTAAIFSYLSVRIVLGYIFLQRVSSKMTKSTGESAPATADAS